MNIKKINKSIVIYLGLLVIGVLINLCAPLLAPYDPNMIEMSNKLVPPSSLHWLGTDQLGRDLLSRLIYGGRTSIIIAAIATSCSMLIGLIVGIVAGYFGGWIDTFITTCSNIMQGLPAMTMMIAIIGIIGPGNESLILALVLTSWASFSRFVRGEVIKVKQESYLEAMECLSASHLYTIMHVIIPNIRGNCLVLFTTRVGRVVLSVSGLSFLGIGVQPPTPDWGVMISDARRYFRGAPHLLIAPVLCIILFSLIVNLLGDALRDKYDIKNDSIKEW